MSSFFLAAKSILPLFLVILTGIGMVRIKAVHPGWVDVLNKYALWIGLPSLIFVALVRLDFRFSEYSSLILSNSIYLVVCILLTFPVSALFKTSVKTKRTLFLLLGFGNISKEFPDMKYFISGNSFDNQCAGCRSSRIGHTDFGCLSYLDVYVSDCFDRIDRTRKGTYPHYT